MELSSQQFTLIEYYHRKSVDSLKTTQKKYEEYAKVLSEQCNRLRSDVDVLYNYLQEAQVFVANGKAACTELTKELRETDRDKHTTFPWCKRDESDSEDSDTDSCTSTTSP